MEPSALNYLVLFIICGALGALLWGVRALLASLGLLTRPHGWANKTLGWLGGFALLLATGFLAVSFIVRLGVIQQWFPAL